MSFLSVVLFVLVLSCALTAVASAVVTVARVVRRNQRVEAARPVRSHLIIRATERSRR